MATENYVQRRPLDPSAVKIVDYVCEHCDTSSSGPDQGARVETISLCPIPGTFPPQGNPDGVTCTLVRVDE